MLYVYPFAPSTSTATPPGPLSLIFTGPELVINVPTVCKENVANAFADAGKAIDMRTALSLMTHKHCVWLGSTQHPRTSPAYAEASTAEIRPGHPSNAI